MKVWFLITHKFFLPFLLTMLLSSTNHTCNAPIQEMIARTMFSVLSLNPSWPCALLGYPMLRRDETAATSARN
jgi:hypothetical protein